MATTLWIAALLVWLGLIYLWCTKVLLRRRPNLTATPVGRAEAEEILVWTLGWLGTTILMSLLGFVLILAQIIASL